MQLSHKAQEITIFPQNLLNKGLPEINAPSSQFEKRKYKSPSQRRLEKKLRAQHLFEEIVLYFSGHSKCVSYSKDAKTTSL
jgi:hypothetical protein